MHDLFTTPVLMATEQQLIAAEAGIANLSEDEIAEAKAAFAGANEDELMASAGVRVTDNGTAIVPIRGMITKTPSWLTYFGLATSSDLLRNTFTRLAKRDDVKRVYLDVNSGGGSVMGVEMATRALRALSAVKETKAFVNDVAASAAYYIASAASTLYVSPSSITGSIGVMVTLMDQSKMLEDAGIRVRIVRSAEFKNLLNGVEPITEKALEEVEASVNKYHNDFVEAIATNLNISKDDANKMADGKTYDGVDAIAAGLADGELTIDAAIEMAEQRDDFASLLQAQHESATATIEALNAERDTLTADVERLTAEVAAMREAQAEAQVTTLINAAIEAGKIGEGQREKQVEFAAKYGIEALTAKFDDIPAAAQIPTEKIDEETASAEASTETDLERSIFAQFPSLSK